MTTATKTEITAADALKYAAAMLDDRTDWACDAIGGSVCDLSHEIELDAIRDAVSEIKALAAQFGDPMQYSNGRCVKTTAEIQFGLITSHVWHPDAAAEEPRSWSSDLPSDPGVPSPGRYEVRLDPLFQLIHVRIDKTVWTR